MIRQEIQKLLERALNEANLDGQHLVEIELEVPRESVHGDYASNIALLASAKFRKSPQEVARIISSNIKYQIGKSKYRVIDRIEIVEPGFINFFLSTDCLRREVWEILKQKEKYGNLPLGQNRKVQVEFISANPTGPLTIGNARGGFWGDVLGNTLQKAGFKVEKAYYINDYGMQVLTLGHSVLKDDQAKYQGDYIEQLKARLKEKDPYKAGEWAAKQIIEEVIKKTVLKMGVKFDSWISETWLHRSGKVDKALAVLKSKKLIYEKEGASWFRSSQFGDQRDRVIIKQDEWKTYLAGDAGLHYYKFSDKKFSKVINIWGADHYGDVPGLQAVVEALGHKGKLDIILLQFVTLIQGGQELKMSKRSGIYVTMDELLETVGLAAARFFFLQKSADTHLNFDMDLAKEQSDKNPVFYIQYAHARICSIFEKAKAQKMSFKTDEKNLELLEHPSELSLIKHLARWPEVVLITAQDYQIQRLPQYALDLASCFSAFYRDCRVISEDKNLTQARLDLARVSQIVLKNVLDLLGIPAPEKM